MNTLLVCTVLVSFIEASNTLRCFICAQERSNYVLEQKTTKLCRYFNGSDPSYAFDCPHSSMCVLEHITLDMGNGFKSKATKRYCAHQIEKGEQEYNATIGLWIQTKKIQEVYREGCFTEDNYGEKSTKAVRCYCRGNLCNGNIVAAEINSSTRSYISVINLTVSLSIMYLYS